MLYTLKGSDKRAFYCGLVREAALYLYKGSLRENIYCRTKNYENMPIETCRFQICNQLC